MTLVGGIPVKQGMVVVTRRWLEQSSGACLASVALLARAHAAPDKEAEQDQEEGATTGSNGNDGGHTERHVRLETRSGFEGGSSTAAARAGTAAAAIGSA